MLETGVARARNACFFASFEVTWREKSSCSDKLSCKFLKLTKNAFEWHKAIKAALLQVGNRQLPQVKNSAGVAVTLSIVLIALPLLCSLPPPRLIQPLGRSQWMS